MEKLVFVYNKDSGVMNGIFDFFHKMMVPSTYNCSLCMVTYNYIGMRSAWKSYLNSLPVEVDFLHKDEFQTLYPNTSFNSFPLICVKNESELLQIVSPEQLNESDLVGLMSLINKHIKK